MGKELSLKSKSIFVNISLILSTIILGVLLSSFIFRVWISPPIDSTLKGNTPLEKIIQVNVINATGQQGLANKVRIYLRDRGFDVVELDNSKEIFKKSIILDRVGDKISSHKLSYALGIRDSLISTAIDSNLYLKATIIVGKDYQSLKPFN